MSGWRSALSGNAYRFVGRAGLWVALWLAGCSSDGPQAQRTPKAVLVGVQEVRTGSIRDWFEAAGSTEPRRRIHVVSQVEGILQVLPFREGDPVSEGEVLARIDGAKLQAEVQELEARTEFARLDVERLEQLTASEGTSQEVLDRARTEYRSWQARRSKAQAMLEDATLSAPFAGIVSARFVDVGDVVAPRSKLLDLLEAEPDHPDAVAVRFKAYVPERRIRKVALGQRAEMILDAYPDSIFVGHVSRIYPEVDPGARGVAVEVGLRNPEGALRPGLLGVVRIVVEVREDAMLIPAQSLVARPTGGEICFVVREGRAEARPVTRGLEAAGMVEVVRGLNVGEQVIVRGQHRLKDGTSVKVQESAEESREKKERSVL